jgi:outer membrane immunogenic protein
MKRLILGVAAALLLSAGPAIADGMPTKGSVKAAPAAAGPNWNGFYVGVGIGAGAVVHDVSVSARDHEYEYEYDSTSRNVLGFDGIGGEGVFGTVTIGYDRVIRPGWVAGVFLDYDFSNISSDLSIPAFGGLSASLDHSHSWSVGARLGFLTNASTLLYGTAGYTQADFDLRTNVSYINDYLRSPTVGGYFVGAGIETFLRDNWTLKLEYRFSQFDKDAIFDYDGIKVDLEPSMHTARLVLSYKFGHPHD